MAKDDKDFKIVDKRFSAGAQDERSESKKKKEETEGDGFVMKDSSQVKETAGQIDFSTFILSLATGAFIHMGLAPDPSTKKTYKNVELAKQNIELLALIKDKTKGNLSGDESQLLESLLTEVRLRFVEASR